MLDIRFQIYTSKLSIGASLLKQYMKNKHPTMYREENYTFSKQHVQFIYR